MTALDVYPPGTIAAAWAAAMGETTSRVPPHATLLGLAVCSARADHVELAWTPPALAGNPLGFVHGGMVAAALDDAAGLSAAVGDGVFCAMRTLHLAIDFIRPTVLHKPHRVCGEVLHRGSTRVLAQARLLDDDQRLVATGSGSFSRDRTAPPRDIGGDEGS